MLFTEDQLQPMINPFSILNEATYLTEEESRTYPHMIPIMQSSSGNILPYYYLEDYANKNNIKILDALNEISQVHDLNSVCISVDETDIVENPKIVEGLENYTIVPLPPNDLVYRFCENTIQELIFTEDSSSIQDKLLSPFINLGDKAARYWMRKDREEFDKGNERLESLNKTAWHHVNRRNNFVNGIDQSINNVRSLPIYSKNPKEWTDEERKQHEALKQKYTVRAPFILKKLHKKAGDAVSNYENAHRDMEIQAAKLNRKHRLIGTSVAIGTALPVLGIPFYLSTKAIVHKIAERYENKPRTLLAKKIAALRNIYSSWMKKANSSKDPGIVARLKQGAAKILQVIDKLMEFLQKKADFR